MDRRSLLVASFSAAAGLLLTGLIAAPVNSQARFTPPVRGNPFMTAFQQGVAKREKRKKMRNKMKRRRMMMRKQGAL